MKMRKEQERKILENLKNSDVYESDDIRKIYFNNVKNNAEVSGLKVNKSESSTLNVKKGIVGAAIAGIILVSSCSGVSLLGTRKIVNDVVSSGCIDNEVYSMNYSNGYDLFVEGEDEPLETDSYLERKTCEIMQQGFTADEAYITLLDLYGTKANIDDTSLFSRFFTKMSVGKKYIGEFIDYVRDFENNGRSK